MSRWNHAPDGGNLVGGIILWSAIIACTLLSVASANAQEPFDHFSTSFPLDGAHLSVSCEGCHTGASFQGKLVDCMRVRKPVPPADDNTNMKAGW